MPIKNDREYRNLGLFEQQAEDAENYIVRGYASTFEPYLMFEQDGVTFNLATPSSEPITVDKDYPGTRIFIIAHMDTIEYNMSVDIGFGDVVTPCPVVVDFPLLLSDLPAVSIQAYSIETVIAEKFHSMIDRDVANSRMKDFFDCYMLLTLNQEIDNGVLREAIFATFSNRELHYNADLQLFTEAFATDETRIKRWELNDYWNH